MKIIEIMIIAMLTCGCTISINVVNSKGTANDVIDETQSPTNTTTPTVSVPISGAGI
jgi:hypothetical protein